MCLIGLVACSEDSASRLLDGGASVDSSPFSDSGSAGDSGVPSDVGAMTDAGVAPGAELFSPERLIEVEVELSADDWARIRSEGRELTATLAGCEREFDYTYVRGTVTVDGQTYEDVAVRKKGFMGSLSVLRPSLKLNFGRFEEGRTHAGMKRMTLNNNKQDPSNTHQCMAYELFRSAGVIAPRCNLARVVVNGEELGIYTHVESVKKPMIARYFEDDGGNLYEGQAIDFVPEHREFIELKTNEEANDRSDFDALSSALLVPDEQLLDALGQAIDLDAFLSFWAMEVITGHWDSYSGGRNNYLAYHDPTSGLFYFIPWGTDGAFSMQRPFTPENTAASLLAQGRIANRLYNHPEGRVMYRERLRELFDRVWDEASLLAEADRIQGLTEAPQGSIDAQKRFVVSHGQALQRELEMDPVEWIDGVDIGPPMCRIELRTDTQGAFSTTWSAGNARGPDQNLDITLNMDPWTPEQLLVSSGVSQLSPNDAQIRYLSPQPDGSAIIVVLSIPTASFSVGEHSMHGFETNGVVARVNPQNPSGVVIIGVIGDGVIQLDQASTEDGGAVSGSFEGSMLQIRPL